jgi:hypothetical protein
MDFKDKAPEGNKSTSNMESQAGRVDFKEHVLGGGDMAKGTAKLESQYADYFPVDTQYLRIANNGFASDVAYETKPVTVGYGGDFKISWFQYFEIEENYDGGVVEISVNGGDWADVTQMGGVFEGAGYTGELADLLPGRQAFTGFMDFPGDIETVNFGTKLNGNEVRFRFRIVSDTNSNEFGWIIDNVTFTNIVTSVFHEQTAGDVNPCVNRLPNVSLVTSATEVKEGEAVSITAAAIDANAGDTLTYTWVQTSGTAATLTGKDTASLSFTAPNVDADEVLEFALTVNDGTDDVVSTVLITVKNNNIPVVSLTPSATEVKEGEDVSITAVAIDADSDDILTYSWAQTSGTAVTLTGADTASLSFTAPQVSANETLEFALTVNDGTDDVVSTISVKVNDIPAPTPTPTPNKSSGGSLGWLTFILLPLATLRRRK